MSRADEEAMDRIADAVSGGASLSAAARRAKLSLPAAHGLWARIVARLGEQAR